jgi:hypothetical protein
MDPDELAEFREDIGEIFEDCIPQILEYHEVNLAGPGGGGSTINSNFGFVEDTTPPITTKSELHFTIVQKPHRAKKLPKPGDEWVGSWDCKIYIPTQDLLDKGVTLDRDHGYFRLPDGTEWKIEAIREQPKTGSGSITHICNVSKRKPQEDDPGAYG